MRSALTGPDNYGARWSYDRTISVRNAPTGYVIQDTIAHVTHIRQSLDMARRIVAQILEQRPQIDWRAAWVRRGRSAAIGSSWQIDSADGAIAIWIQRLPDEWWSIEVDINRNIEGGMRPYGWRVEGYHPIGVVQAQATAWASHHASGEDSP